MAIFAVCNLAAVIINQSLIGPLWAVGLPVTFYLIWQMRYWNCNQRLVTSNFEIEWKRDGLWGCKPCLHKKCGASLL